MEILLGFLVALIVLLAGCVCFLLLKIRRGRQTGGEAADHPDTETTEAGRQEDAETGEEEEDADNRALTEEEKDEALFRAIHEKVVEEKLFLDPAFSRDRLVRLGLTNKNKMAFLLRTYAHNNFNGYINELRLQYALQLLRREPDITVKALALDSGFNSLRTFYRLFQQKYGMTPMEYKEKYLKKLS